MNGRCFYFKDGTKEWFDPVSDWEERDGKYFFYVFGWEHQIPIDSVERIEEYDPDGDKA